MIRPKKIRIEASTACQLRCPACQTARGTTGRSLGTGHLRAADFLKVLEANPWIESVELSNWGEIFLNPELLTIVKLADERNVELHADNGVNFNTATPAVLEGLVRYRFRSMTVAIDGATSASYEIYRQRGDLNQVLDNIRSVNRWKTELGSEYPALTWQFVPFGHNEDEISQARSMAKELGMQFFVKLAWDASFDGSEVFSPVRNTALVRSESGVGAADRIEFHERYGDNYLQKTICSQLWSSPQINWDGRVLGCCVNYWGDFGNAFEHGLSETLNGEKLEYARRMLRGIEPARPDIPCSTCPHYKRMLVDQRWMSPAF